MSRRCIVSPNLFAVANSGQDASTAPFSQQRFNPLKFIYHGILESGNIQASEFSVQSGIVGWTKRITFANTYSSVPPVIVFHKSPRSPYGAIMAGMFYDQGYGGTELTDGGAQLYSSYSADATGLRVTFNGNASNKMNIWPIGHALDTFWAILQS